MYLGYLVKMYLDIYTYLLVPTYLLIKYLPTYKPRPCHMAFSLSYDMPHGP
jgi:hypothetical protein